MIPIVVRVPACWPVFAVILWIVMTSVPMNAQPPETGALSERWAIALHGGAGSDPSRWEPSRRSARRAGLETALRIGRDALSNGDRSIDVVVAVIRSMEDNPVFNAGRGSVVTREGKAELDASLMEGRTHRCGAVAGVVRLKNPIHAARLVMDQSPHVLLSGEGADSFAASQGAATVDPEYFLSAHRPQSSEMSQDHPYLGTVGCVVLDRHGDLAAGTSTGGTKNKLPGRVGDSPIIGAGTYADNATCAVSATGIGEEFIRHAIAYDVTAMMRYSDRSLADAIRIAIDQRLRPGDGGLIGVSHDGSIALRHNTPGMSCGAADSQGRFEVFLEVKQD